MIKELKKKKKAPLILSYLRKSRAQRKKIKQKICVTGSRLESHQKIQNTENLVSSPDSFEFTHFTQCLTRSSIIGLDAEWKPIRGRQPQPTFPTVSLLQLACQLGPDPDESEVFLLDLSAIPLPSLWALLKVVFVSPDILKLGFRFKQDLAYLSSTFCSQGCHPGFDKVEPYLDISSIYHYRQHKQARGKAPKETKSLATICKEVLDISLSKELQCSDWSCRPLTEEQKTYAASDAHCLLKIFGVFQSNAIKGDSYSNMMELHFSTMNLGLKEVFQNINHGDKITRIKFAKAGDIVRATVSSEHSQRIAKWEGVASRNTIPMDESLSKLVRKYGERIILKESDRKPKAPKKKGKKNPSLLSVSKEKQLDGGTCDWVAPPPWDLSSGGDGCPKFLCDVMIEGLAKHLRCIGVDAAVPRSRKPEPRELIDQAYKEHRVLLTRDAKLLRHQHMIKNQIYRMKSLLKNDQLLEVIRTFQLKISEDQLMSRCTKCNGRFIQRPLTAEEAVEAATRFQRIPSCLFNKDLEFWQCMDCNQLYWEGGQYHNAVQKFINICNLNEQPEILV